MYDFRTMETKIVQPYDDVGAMLLLAVTEIELHNGSAQHTTDPELLDRFKAAAVCRHTWAWAARDLLHRIVTEFDRAVNAASENDRTDRAVPAVQIEQALVAEVSDLVDAFDESISFHVAWELAQERDDYHGPRWIAAQRGHEYERHPLQDWFIIVGAVEWTDDVDNDDPADVGDEFSLTFTSFVNMGPKS
jgi:hypothetical protein